MTEVGMHEAKSRLSQLVRQAEAGEDIVISRNGEPVARLVPIRPAGTMASVRGAWKGQQPVVIGEDFDELPDEMAAAFGVRP
jgi:prevent-host-death family protein